jgi:hypothetical protein
MAHTVYSEELHPRDTQGRWKDKGAGWMADNPLMTRKGMISSSAATAASSLFLVFDSVFKFVIAIFSVATVSLVSWGGYRRRGRRRSGGSHRPMSRLDRMLGTTRATSSNWAAPRNADAKAIIARAEAKALLRDNRFARHEIRKVHRRETRQKVYANFGRAAVALGSRRQAPAAQASDPFVMSKDEMRSAADSIGLRMEGRRVQLLDVNESTGTALIVDKGAPRNVPVAKLDWDDPE